MRLIKIILFTLLAYNGYSQNIGIRQVRGLTSKLNSKTDTSNTVTVNGNSQRLGSNPSFTVSGGNSIGNVTKDVTTFGAKGDGKYFTGASISSGSAVATITSGGFASTDVGKYIDIGGAGVSGARLISTIASVQSATSITLGNTASTTVSAQSGKYGTDNTNAFQDAIYSLANNGTYNGKIIVPYTGYPYFFSKAVSTLSRDADTVNNAQIYIPASGTWGSNVSKFGTIEIEGEISPNFYTDPVSRTTATPQKMVILQSTLDNGALFGNAYTNIGEIGCGVSGGTRINFTLLKIKNIAGRVNSKNGSAQVKAATTAFDFSNMGMLEMSNILADVESTSSDEIQPDTATQYGIKTMSTCNWAHQVIENVVIRGFGNGFSLSEHSVVRNIYVASCYNGIVIQPTLHMAQVTKALVQWTHNNIKITGASKFDIKNIDFENSSSVPVWQRLNLDIYEPTLTSSTGSIVYHILGTPSTLSSGLLSPLVLVNKLGDLGVVSRMTTGFAGDITGSLAGDYKVRIKNSLANAAANAILQMENSGSLSQILKYSATKGTYKNQGPSDLSMYNGTAGNISLLQDRTAGFISLQGSSGTGLQVLGVNSHVLIGTSTDNSTLTVNGSMSLPYTFKGGDYTLTANDYTVDCITNSSTMTLPTAVGIAGRIYVIKNRTPGLVVTVATTSSETIDGSTTYSLSAQYKYVVVQSSGTNWMVIGNN